MIPGSEQLASQYGIAGLAVLILIDKLAYIVLRKKDKTERGERVENLVASSQAAAKSIESMSKALVDLNKKFEGVNFRRMELEVNWLKETHAATDPSGTLRLYDKSSELKETLKNIEDKLGRLLSKQ